MRISLALLVLTVFIVAGCAHHKNAASKSASAPAAVSTAPVVTPSGGLTGKVARYNDAGRFVVLEFPVGHMPSPEQRLFAYRGGLKVGEIKVTGPQRGDHIVADLTSGEAQAGDEVRDK